MGDPLPADVRPILEREGVPAAGDRLCAWAEEVARRDPGVAVERAGRLLRWKAPDRLMGGYVRWAAGIMLHLAGRVDASREALGEAVSTFEREGRRVEADRVRLLLLDVLAERHELARARRLAADLHRRFLERGDRRRAAVALANLACAEDAADRVARARDLWRRARSHLEPGSSWHLLVEANLANVAVQEGRFQEASAGLRRVAEHAREAGMEAVAVQAELNLAEAEFAAGDVGRALERWQRVIRTASAAGFPAVELTGEVDLAHAEVALGDVTGACRRLKRTLPRLRSVGLAGEERRARRLAAVLQGPGGWRQAEGVRGVPAALLVVEAAGLDPDLDSRRVERAARRLIAEGMGHKGRLGLAWAARSAAERGRWRRAGRLAREVLDNRRSAPWARMVAHHVLGRVPGPARLRHLATAARLADGLSGRLAAPADREAFLRLRGHVYADYLELLLERGGSRNNRRALEVLARLQLGWLEEELARRADRAGDPLVERWQRLLRRLAALLREMEGESEPRIRRAGLAVQRLVHEVELELHLVELELDRRRPARADDRRWEGIADRLLEALPAGHLYAKYYLGDEDLVIFVAGGGGLRVHRVPAVVAELERLISSVRFHLDSHAQVAGATWAVARRSLEVRLHRLGRILLDPLELSGAGTVWIAPHGILHRVPWPALPVDDGSPLLERSRVTVVPGSTVTMHLLGRRPSRPRSAVVAGASLGVLPMVDREVEALGRVVGGVQLVEAAGRERFLELLRDFDLVHLAGHAVFLDGLPDASGLRLADGYVTIHDLMATPLGARMVTFGVCSALRVGGRGDRSAGFVRALMTGGVGTVVGPTAPVTDEVASTFDLAFFSALEECADPGVAFHEGIGAVIRNDPDPAGWAAFQMYGDPRPWGT